jgi:hypothetical protein
MNYSFETASYRELDSVDEWYKLKWRKHNHNQRFSTPNVSTDPSVDDLNKLLVNSSHHAVRVNRRALDRTGRNPFMNDNPPALYTAIRLVVPAINSLMTDDERDELLSTGRFEKTLTKADILASDLVLQMANRPGKLGKWVDGALELMVSDLKCARKLPDTEPQQYVITIDNALLKQDVREVWTDRTATKAAKSAAKRGRRRGKGGNSNQPGLFD